MHANTHWFYWCTTGKKLHINYIFRSIFTAEKLIPFSFYISVFNKCARLHFDITSFEPSTAVRSFMKHKNKLVSCLQKSFQTSFAAVLCWSFLVCNTCLGYESMRQGQANSARATSIHRYTRLWKFIMLELCWQLP